MKKIVLSVAALAASACAFAESDVLFNPDNEPYFGARATLDISSASNGGGVYSNSPGFSVGAVYNIPIWKNLFFEPGVMAFYDTFGLQQAVPYMPDVTDPDNVRYLLRDGSIRNFGFRMPLNMGYRFDFAEEFGVSVFTGPQLNFSATAKAHWNALAMPDGTALPTQSESIFGTGGWKRLDLQWNFGVGVSWQHYYCAVQGSVGVTRVLEDTFRRNLCSISLGYNF